MILAIIQARMGGQRYPGKVLKKIEGVSMVEHIIRRVDAAEVVDRVCVAIPDTPENDILEATLADSAVTGCEIYRGDEDNVLSRFYWASQGYADADAIVRITADDPFKDPVLIDLCVGAFVAEWALADAATARGVSDIATPAPPHYSHLGGATWPLGCDVEVFTPYALTQAWRHDCSAEGREHVTPNMREIFGVWVLKNPYGYGDASVRWTVDTPDDLAFARGVYKALYPSNPLFGFAEMQELGV